mmetsp:Transcript_7937/g.12253  ORF Transcript_7937/g.12253 Transcript_7937/m.12253 type:complete len:200 (-) Transcript_7937:278-877(-)
MDERSDTHPRTYTHTYTYIRGNTQISIRMNKVKRTFVLCLTLYRVNRFHFIIMNDWLQQTRIRLIHNLLNTAILCGTKVQLAHYARSFRKLESGLLAIPIRIQVQCIVTLTHQRLRQMVPKRIHQRIRIGMRVGISLIQHTKQQSLLVFKSQQLDESPSYLFIVKEQAHRRKKIGELFLVILFDITIACRVVKPLFFDR